MSQAGRTQTTAQINLEQTDQWKEYRHKRMTPEIKALFGQTALAREACERLLDGYAAYINPLHKRLPRSWAVLNAAAGDAFLVETQGQKYGEPEGTMTAVSLMPVFPVPGGICSFGLYYGVGPSPNSDEEDLADLEKRVRPLPMFIQQVLRNYEHVYMNCSSPSIVDRDVEVVSTVPYGSTSIEEFVSGSSKQALSQRFGDLYDIRVLGQQLSKRAWCIFFDESEKGDQTLFVALDEEFQNVRQLTEPQEAYDLMFEHYLLGKSGEFDFEPLTAAL